MAKTNTTERRLLQVAIALAGCVPVLAGFSGAFGGIYLMLDVSPGELNAANPLAMDNHFRYLSGLLLGIGLAFWSFIPAIEHKTVQIRMLTVIIVIGGLARLGGLAVGNPGPAMQAALVMELVVTPLLCLWQGRIAKHQLVIPRRRP